MDKNFMVDSVKGCTEVEENQNWMVIWVSIRFLAIYYFDQCSLCAVLGSKTGLKRLEDVVIIIIFFKSVYLIKNNFF